MKKGIPVIFAVCLLVFSFAGYMIAKELTGQKEEINDFDALAGLVAVQTTPVDSTQPEKDAISTDIETPSAPATRNLTPLFEKNPDCIGWLFLEGTVVDYPVMHTPTDPERYLRKNFDKEKSSAGVPFLEGLCTLECDHLIIYGHNMRNGTMFADVTKYHDKQYCAAHPVMELETAQGLKQYTVFAAVRVKADDSWYAFHSPTDEAEYNGQIAEIKSRALYDTGITPKYGQQLLTLSTCYGSDKNDRILIIGVENA